MAINDNRNIIIHVIDSLGLGGAEKLVVNTINHLDEFDHVICLLNGSENKFDKIGNGNVLAIIDLEHKNNLSFLNSVFKLKKIINKYKPYLVHAHLLKSTWIARFAVGRKIPFYFTVHNLLSEDAFKVNKLSFLFEKLTYKSGQKLICVSKGVLKDYEKWIGVKGPAYILYNLIDQDFFSIGKKTKNTNDILRLVAVGNLRRQKNYLTLLKAFSLLKGLNVCLDIYGEGSEMQVLSQFIKDNNLPVELKGRKEKISEVLPDYDGYIMASLFEGYGIAPVEAMAVGLPLLLSDIPVLREVTSDKALYFNPTNPGDIASTIIQFKDLSIEEKEKISKRFQHQAFQMASPETFKKSLIDIYNSEI